MRKTWTHLMVSDTFYFIVDDTIFYPKGDKPYCPLTLFTIQTRFRNSISVYVHRQFFSYFYTFY